MTFGKHYTLIIHTVTYSLPAYAWKLQGSLNQSLLTLCKRWSTLWTDRQSITRHTATDNHSHSLQQTILSHHLSQPSCLWTVQETVLSTQKNPLSITGCVGLTTLKRLNSVFQHSHTKHNQKLITSSFVILFSLASSEFIKFITKCLLKFFPNCHVRLI